MSTALMNLQHRNIRLGLWLGFFAWYRGLALGGTVRVSQMQLMQPFLSMLFVGRKMPVSTAR